MKSETAVIINEFASNGGYEGAKRSIVGTCANIAANAKLLCPVDEGQLRNTIMYRTKETEGLFNNESGDKAPSDQKLEKVDKELTGYVGTNSDHWYPEFGTRNQVAQPYLRPAGELAKGTNVKEIAVKYSREAMKEEFSKRKVVKRGL